ncbi:hypothetical protein RQP53_00480 [Paucibacter sp. APW11]|uniref:Uncharacterized protein n=1 Tax=Roseateles aquae TaxID=3077235 RepID=A0ABU3P594_9BURK|nr:hypothetical protein [Paucibacter sp. APW11]MDT8997744.1 hypothetical protein [Paucibacter sp. APW11]
MKPPACRGRRPLAHEVSQRMLTLRRTLTMERQRRQAQWQASLQQLDGEPDFVPQPLPSPALWRRRR